MNTVESTQEFNALLAYLQRRRGFDFTVYRLTSLRQRIHSRMHAVGVACFGAYQAYLDEHPEEFTRLFDMLLNHGSAFFRDRRAWDYLSNMIVPQLLAAKPVNRPLRIWCASRMAGEEIYTLAMVLADILGLEAFHQHIRLYATVMDEGTLATVRQARYSPKRLKAVPAHWRERYFRSVGADYAIRLELRRAVIFGHHNVLEDAPFPRLDLLVCRNMLLYFPAEAQAHILTRFHFALNAHGVLFLGQAENLPSPTDLFVPVHLESRLFAKRLSDCIYNDLGSLALTKEELEISNEELEITNEELHAANEELQTMNGELEVSKQELQDFNAELQSLNDELCGRTSALN